MASLVKTTTEPISIDVLIGEAIEIVPIAKAFVIDFLNHYPELLPALQTLNEAYKKGSLGASDLLALYQNIEVETLKLQVLKFRDIYNHLSKIYADENKIKHHVAKYIDGEQQVPNVYIGANKDVPYITHDYEKKFLLLVLIIFKTKAQYKTLSLADFLTEDQIEKINQLWQTI